MADAAGFTQILWITLWVNALIKGKYLIHKDFSEMHNFQANNISFKNQTLSIYFYVNKVP